MNSHSTVASIHKPARNPNPNPHDKLMERAWRHCREGIKLCEMDEKLSKKAIHFSREARRVAPQAMDQWITILHGGHSQHVTPLMTVDPYFDLPEEEQDWWDQMIQSHPFAPVLGPIRRQQRRMKSHADG